MTIREAIAGADAQRPNSIDEQTKFGWLNELEGIVQTRILQLSTDDLTQYIAQVDYSGSITVPDTDTVVLAHSAGFRVGDTVRITATGNNGVSAKLRSVSSDGLTLGFDTGAFTVAPSASGTALADRRDTALIVPAPYDRVYESYLMQRIDLALGESDRFNNDRTWHNTLWDDFAKWYNRTHIPGTAEMRGFVLTAYGLALKHGFVGTEEDWLSSLRGEQGFGILLRYDSGVLQWRSEGENVWHELLTLSQLQGSVVSDTLTQATEAKTGAEAAQTAAESAQTWGQYYSNVAKVYAEGGEEPAAPGTIGSMDLITGAMQYAAQAQTAKTGAQAAKAGAEAAKTGAETAKAGAETAKAGAETARAAAETAKTGAETAKATAEAASGTAATKAQEASVSADAAAGSASASAQSAVEAAQSAQEAAAAAGGGVTSLNGRTGAVTVVSDDITDAAGSGSLTVTEYTAAEVQALWDSIT